MQVETINRYLKVQTVFLLAFDVVYLLFFTFHFVFRALLEDRETFTTILFTTQDIDVAFSGKMISISIV